MSGSEIYVTPDFVRLYVRDSIENNKLLRALQFPDENIIQCRNLALLSYNAVTPITNETFETFPNQVLLLYGTLYHLFNGVAASAARNELNYSDAGITVNIEDKVNYYSQLASNYLNQFQSMVQQFKIQQNLESGYDYVSSDYGYFPAW